MSTRTEPAALVEEYVHDVLEAAGLGHIYVSSALDPSRGYPQVAVVRAAVTHRGTPGGQMSPGYADLAAAVSVWAPAAAQMAHQSAWDVAVVITDALHALSDGRQLWASALGDRVINASNLVATHGVDPETKQAVQTISWSFGLHLVA